VSTGFGGGHLSVYSISINDSRVKIAICETFLA
jgi:hypothetical protein